MYFALPVPHANEESKVPSRCTESHSCVARLYHGVILPDKTAVTIEIQRSSLPQGLVPITREPPVFSLIPSITNDVGCILTQPVVYNEWGFVVVRLPVLRSVGVVVDERRSFLTQPVVKCAKKERRSQAAP